MNLRCGHCDGVFNDGGSFHAHRCEGRRKAIGENPHRRSEHLMPMTEVMYLHRFQRDGEAVQFVTLIADRSEAEREFQMECGASRPAAVMESRAVESEMVEAGYLLQPAQNLSM